MPANNISQKEKDIANNAKKLPLFFFRYLKKLNWTRKNNKNAAKANHRKLK